MAKEHPIDTEVRAIRALQDECARRSSSRLTQISLLCFVSILLLAFGLGIYLLLQNTVSEEENRTLQTLPQFSVKTLLSGEYTASLATFYADQFPLRDSFVGMKAFCEIFTGKQENNGVLYGKDGTLIDRLEYGEDAYGNLKANLLALAQFETLAEEQNHPVTFAVAPRTADVLKNAYPALYADNRIAMLPQQIAMLCDRAVLFSETLETHANNGEYVMYRTDHHWTTLGAYYAYVALADELGYTPLPRDAFTEMCVSESFLGTTYSSSGIKWTSPDSVTLFRSANESDFSIVIRDTETALDGFYDFSALSEKDKYRVFLGGNHGHVSISLKNETEARPTLLLVKDSFALSLVPFLAQHYDIEMIDLRYYTGIPADLLSSCDETLVLMGADSLAESQVLRKLLFGALK